MKLAHAVVWLGLLFMTCNGDSDSARGEPPFASGGHPGSAASIAQSCSCRRVQQSTRTMTCCTPATNGTSLTRRARIRAQCRWKRLGVCSTRTSCSALRGCGCRAWTSGLRSTRFLFSATISRSNERALPLHLGLADQRLRIVGRAGWIRGPSSCSTRMDSSRK